MASSLLSPSFTSFPRIKKDVSLSAFTSQRCFKALPRRIIRCAVAAPQRQPSTTGSVRTAMTMTEKILARASEKVQLTPGDNVWVNVDILMTHDVCGPGSIGIFKREFGDDAKVWDREKLVIIPDHYIFTSDERANRNVDILRDFCHEQNIKYFYDIKDLSNFKVNPDYKGVCHVALAQEGHCRPGEVLLGTDSHTCTAGAFGQFATGIGNTDAGFVLGTGKLLLKVPPTLRFVMDGEMPDYLLSKDLILQIIGEITVAGATYKSMEFVGTTVESLTMEERMTLCNMVVEAGGKNGVVPADSTTFKYLEAGQAPSPLFATLMWLSASLCLCSASALFDVICIGFNIVSILQGKTSLPYEPVYSDDQARFLAEYRFDVSKLEPVVAKPHSPDNRALARECKDVKIDRVYIGSCTGGKTEDFMAAAKVFLASGKQVKVPTFLVPATQKVWMDLYSLPVPGSGGKTCSQIFEEAGCDTPASPSCGACLGGPKDTYARMNEPKASSLLRPLHLIPLNFKLWYTKKIRSRNGVGIIVDKEWKKDVVDVRRVGDRIIALKLVVGQDTFNVISGYAPQVGLAEHFKVKFWEDLEGVLQDIPQGEKVFLGGDLNGHVGSVARGFEGVHGGFGLGEMNGEGKSILEFSEALDLSIANTWFKKREDHLITYKSGGTCSQIDFFLIRKSDRKYCLNCKVIPEESLTTQHRVLVMDVRIRDRAKRRSPMVAPRIKWWHLKGEKQGIFQQKIWEGWCGQSQGSANDLWNKMSQEIIKVAKETLGESRGFGPRGKESWWWNESVQSKVRVKKECFKEWSRCRNSETWDKYKIARNETKKAVSEARAQAFDGLYQALGTRDGERSIYRLAKGRERKTRDLDQVKCVKDEEGKVLVHEKDIKERWKAYFHNLFNDGYGYDSSSLDTREEDRNYKYYRRIQKQEVKEALKRMSNGKAVGPDNIPIEVWKTLGDRGLEWLTKLFNEIMRSKRMPEEWRRSTLVPIYKNKGDIQNCANYRGIKLESYYEIMGKSDRTEIKKGDSSY
ncbi:3-isopropylmalate dehydratase large subunit, chloroplastic [Glycine max]|nr:3-isopropylmalate dehydratase large subunit, chloroplastic [Glycine max]